MYVELRITAVGPVRRKYRFPVNDEPVVIGCASECQIVLQGDAVKARHLVIRSSEDRIILELLGEGEIRTELRESPFAPGETVELKARDQALVDTPDFSVHFRVFKAGGSRWEEFSESFVLGTEQPRPPSPYSVAFAVFGAQQLAAGDQAIIDVWAYRDEHYTWVLDKAAELQRDRLLGKKLGVTIKPGTIVDVDLEVEDCEVPFPREVLIWSGEATNVSFVVNLPGEMSRPWLHGRAVFSVDGIPIGSVQFGLKIAAEEETTPEGSQNQQWRPVRSAFASYASEDRAEVLARLQGVKAVAPEMDVFLDALSLLAGDDWKRELIAAIKQRDAFLLFWSKAAAASAYVKIEYRVALYTHGLGHIRPVPIEDPREAPPPDELSALHFNDAYLAHIDFERRRKSSDGNRRASRQNSVGN